VIPEKTLTVVSTRSILHIVTVVEKIKGKINKGDDSNCYFKNSIVGLLLMPLLIFLIQYLFLMWRKLDRYKIFIFTNRKLKAVSTFLCHKKNIYMPFRFESKNFMYLHLRDFLQNLRFLA
jgi:hypothetical protein